MLRIIVYQVVDNYVIIMVCFFLILEKITEDIWGRVIPGDTGEYEKLYS